MTKCELIWILCIIFIFRDGLTAAPTYAHRLQLPISANDHIHPTGNVNQYYLNRDTNYQRQPENAHTPHVRQAVLFQQPPNNGYLRENHFLPRPQTNPLTGHQQYQTQHEQHFLPQPGLQIQQTPNINRSDFQIPHLYTNRPQTISNQHALSTRPMSHQLQHQLFQHTLTMNPPRIHTVPTPSITIMANNVYINKDDHHNTAAWPRYLDHKLDAMTNPNKPFGLTSKPDFYENPGKAINSLTTANIPKLLMIILPKLFNLQQLEKEKTDEIKNIYKDGTIDTFSKIDGNLMSSLFATNQAHYENNPVTAKVSTESEVKPEESESFIFHPLLSWIREPEIPGH